MSEKIINSEQSLEAYFVFMRAEFEKHKYLRCTHKTGRQRTRTQNAALHLFCDHLSQALNDGGKDFREFIKEGYPVPFNERLVKDYIWRPVQKAITGKDSTTEPEAKEYGLIYDSINVKMAEHGFHVPWPSKDTMPK